MATFEPVPAVTNVAEGSLVKIKITWEGGHGPKNVTVKHPFDTTTSLDLPANLTSGGEVTWDTTGLQPGSYTIGELREGKFEGNSADLLITPRLLKPGESIPVTMRRSASIRSSDLPLWVVIKGGSDALSFSNYMDHMDLVLCGIGKERSSNPVNTEYKRLIPIRALPFSDADAYRLLKVATEAFVTTNCGVVLDQFPFAAKHSAEILKRVEINITPAQLTDLWTNYLQEVNGFDDPVLPYFELIKRKFPEIKEENIKDSIFIDPPDSSDNHQENAQANAQRCYGLLRKKMQQPCLLELIWSYWHEEGMLAQTVAAITHRFQNRRRSSGQDPLANLETDPLRPLNNLLWGYLQDEMHRLTVVRRAYEYDHHYGLRIYGKAVSEFHPADSRSKFIEAFHNLLNICAKFYKGDDDTTVIADGFPILNALRDVHLLLSEGAHNQFGDLPATARIEMLMQQWLLARPEFRQFLPARTMVAYPEPWMDRVDAMKKLQGWTDVNVLHFRNLGVFGEQVLLSIRYGAWSDTNDPKQAANWARFWRAEVQGYIHAYRVVTGVDLSIDVTGKVDTTLPAIHLRNRLLSQMRTPQEQNTLTIPRSRVS